jgi:hypothetical protein
MANEKSGNSSHFFYRENPNRTIDAICGFCFSTAATAKNRADLREMEAAHVCWGTKAAEKPKTMVQ